MNDKLQINKSFLSSGKDLYISQDFYIKHPLLQEVLDIDENNHGFFSEDIYYSWVSIFLCDPYDYMVYLDDKKLDYEKITPFELFVMRFNDLVKSYEETYKPKVTEEEYEMLLYDNYYFQSFRFFTNKKAFFIAKDENGNQVIADPDTMTVLLDENSFSLVSDFIKNINGITECEKIYPEDEFGKQILIEDERSKIKKKLRAQQEEEKSNRLGNIMSALTWCVNGGITPFNRNNLHMYDLVDGINRNDKLLNFNHIMSGLYSGCVNKDKLNIQQISWQN